MKKNYPSLLKSFSFLVLAWVIHSLSVFGVILEIKELQPDPRDDFAYPKAFSSTTKEKILGLCENMLISGKSPWPCIWNYQELSYLKPPQQNLFLNKIEFSKDGSKIFGLARKNSMLELLVWNTNFLNKNDMQERSAQVVFKTQDSREINSFWISEDGKRYILCFNPSQNRTKEEKKPLYNSNCITNLQLSKTKTIARAAVSANGVLYLLIQDSKNENFMDKSEDSLENVRSSTYRILYFDASTCNQYRSKKINSSTLSNDQPLVATDSYVWIKDETKEKNFSPCLLLWDKSIENEPAFLKLPQEIKEYSIEWIQPSHSGEMLTFSFSRKLKEEDNKEHLFYLFEDFEWTKIEDKLVLPNAMTTQLTKVFGSNESLSFAIYQNLKNKERIAYLVNLKIYGDFEEDQTSNKTKKENSIIEFSSWIYKLSKNDERFNPKCFTVLPIDVFNAEDAFESGTWIVSTTTRKEPHKTKFYTVKMVESFEEAPETSNVSGGWCTHQ